MPWNPETPTIEPVPHWPINEVLFESLLLRGKSEGDIAEMFQVPIERVTALREALDL